MSRISRFLFVAGILAAMSHASSAPQGSTYAGSTSTAVYPPPGITPAKESDYFPSPAEVGFTGPTPTGDEAAAIQTAPPVQKTDAYPLTEPQVLFGNKPTASASFNPMRYWANLSPWFSVNSAANGLPGATSQIPEGCEITQLHLVQRHGARYPASGDPPAEFATKLHAIANSTGFSASGPLGFLNTWTYKIGAQLLTPFGRQQLFDQGVAYRVKYGDLLKGFKQLPVFRTTSEARMVDSAISFAAGFFGVQDYQSQYYLSIIIEETGFNNTLAPWTNCPNANGEIYELGYLAQSNWTSVYLRNAVKRLQPYIQGYNLTTDDAWNTQNLCAFETVSLGFSTFCGLFTEEEWKGFEYAIDLLFWYSDGPGNPTTSAEGIGYVEELLSRLTYKPSGFNPVANSTLNNNNVTFPLNQPIYFDFTHDTVIAAIITAMNFTSFNQQGPLPLTHIPKNQTYHVQHIVPFAANLVGQVLSCPVSRTNTTAASYIRWILNDGVVPLTGINACASYKNKDGLCPLDLFITGLQELILQEDWAFDCTANYTVGVPNSLVDGRYHA